MAGYGEQKLMVPSNEITELMELWSNPDLVSGSGSPDLLHRLGLEWKRLYSKMTQASYNEGEEIMTKQVDEVHDVHAQLEDLKTQLAIKQTSLDEKDLVIAEKDRAISALEEDKQAFMEEMNYVITGSIKILEDISEQVLDLTADLEEFQMRNKRGVKSTAPRIRHCHEMPATLLSCAEYVSKKINYAQSALDEAFKEWKRAEDALEMMQSHFQKQCLARILGKAVPVAPDHAVKAENNVPY